MEAHGIVVLPGQGPVWTMSPGRSAALKLLGGATGGSVMLFEETIPSGMATTFHLHHESDEVAYVLSGEITFKICEDVTVGGPGTCAFMPRGVPHAWKNTGVETGRVLFLYTPAGAGGLLDCLSSRAPLTMSPSIRGASTPRCYHYGAAPCRPHWRRAIVQPRRPSCQPKGSTAGRGPGYEEP